MARKPTPRRLPWVLESTSPDETARCLLLQTGSRAAAHEAIKRNAHVLDRPKRPVPDAVLLLMARAIQRKKVQRKKVCRDNAALTEVARDHATSVDAAATLLKRLQRTLKGETLKTFSLRYPKRMQPIL